MTDVEESMFPLGSMQRPQHHYILIHPKIVPSVFGYAALLPSTPINTTLTIKIKILKNHVPLQKTPKKLHKEPHTKNK